MLTNNCWGLNFVCPQPTEDYRPDPTEDALMFPRRTGLREATLLLLKEKCGRYTQLRVSSRVKFPDGCKKNVLIWYLLDLNVWIAVFTSVQNDIGTCNIFHLYSHCSVWNIPIKFLLIFQEPLYLDKCIVCSEVDWEDYFEVQELISKDTFIFKVSILPCN